MPKYDVVVVGLGPCGISSAIYLHRYGHNVCLVGDENTSLKKAHIIENYYGIESISGSDLFNVGIKQANNFNIPIYYEEVIDIEYLSEDEFLINTNLQQLSTKKIMLALGSVKKTMPLASKFEGEGVSYCATCDGFLYRKKKVALVGASLYMMHEYEVLKNIIPNLTIFTNGEELNYEVDCEVITDKIVSFDGDIKLEGITTTNNHYNIDGAFIAIGSQNAFTLAKHLGLALDNDRLIVDSNYMTNVNGIYAGGDVIGGLKQVVKAASDGAVAALSISRSLKK